MGSCLGFESFFCRSKRKILILYFSTGSAFVSGSTAEREAQIETKTMDFVRKAKGYSHRDEEDVEEEVKRSCSTYKLPFSPGSSSSPSVFKLWLGNRDSKEEASRSYRMNVLPSPKTPTNSHERVESIELSLQIDNDMGGDINGARSYGHRGCSEREHMFHKVVTPSDVGKLNRLVIPKQHAEKYFPIDSSTNEKGLILNFEDRNGKSWRFRYSYWNSSQSYVMTKGWSRFVKEKKLDAGDVVSFERGVGDVGQHRLFIDWRRRPDAPQNLASLVHLPRSMRWGSTQLIPPSMASPYPHPHRHFPNHNYGTINPSYYLRGDSDCFNGGSFESGSVYYLRPSSSNAIGALQQGGEAAPMVIDSVPVVHQGSKPKRVRLFGVNLECPVPEEPISNPHFASSSSVPYVHLRPPFTTEFSARGKGSSSFDWNLQ